MHRGAFFGGLESEVIHEPVEVVAVVLHTLLEAMGFCYENAALFIDGKSAGRVNVRGGIGGEDFDYGAIGNRKSGNGFVGNQTVLVGLAGSGGAREFWFGEIGEEEVVDIDKAPGSAFGIDDANAGGLSFKLGDVPNDGAHGEIILAGGFVGEFAIDEKLHGGLSGVISSRDQEGDVGKLDFEFGGSERAG